VPPSLPNVQTIGCTVCSGAAGRTAIGQILRGDPVNTATGAYEETVRDLSMSSFGVPFDLTRTYSSISPATGPLGKGWGFAYDMKMIGANNTPVFQDENGARLTFTRQNDGTYTAPPGIRARLTTSPAGAFRPFRLTTPDQRVLTFLDDGRLASVTDRRQHGLTFKYSTDGSLASITDAGGRVVTLTGSSGRITKATLPDGRSVQYGYTGSDLTTVTDPAGGVTTYGYDGADRLTSATDANNHRMVLNTYDPSTGRAPARPTRPARSPPSTGIPTCRPTSSPTRTGCNTPTSTGTTCWC
jgi:YD repeat-containing protein